MSKAAECLVDKITALRHDRRIVWCTVICRLLGSNYPTHVNAEQEYQQNGNRKKKAPKVNHYDIGSLENFHFQALSSTFSAFSRICHTLQALYNYSKLQVFK